MSEPMPLLELSGIHKRYGGVAALRGASLRVARAGTVHGLIGENGSGKSTMLKMLSGQERPDEGTIRLHGEAVDIATPADAVRAGVAMVTQESALADHLSVAENILLGRLPTRAGRAKIDWRATRRVARDTLARLNVGFDVDTPVGRLRPDQRQMVEIARTLSMDARVLILDEPSSSLTDDEVQALFATIRELSRQDVVTIFVSHRLNELFEIADEITVLRDGETVSHGAIGDYTAASLVADMVGDPNRAATTDTGPDPTPIAAPADHDGPALDVRNLTVPGAVSDVSLTVGRGEIVGLCGLVGAGRSELLQALFGARARSTGEVVVGGRPADVRNPTRAIHSGLGYVPAERRTEGLVLQSSVVANLTMVESLGKSRLARPSRVRAAAALGRIGSIMRLSVPSARARVETLSGGNQQKVCLGKWLLTSPTVLLLDEPTRGIDVAAKDEIHRLLRDCAGSGAGVLVSSSENSELRAICDRILVMFRGAVTADLPVADATPARLAHYGGGRDGDD